MKKVVILIIFIMFFLSCETKKENFSNEMIEKLDHIDNGLPSRYGFLNLFVATDNNEFIETNCDYLFTFYELYFNNEFKTFKDFLNAVLNDDYVIHKNVFNKKIHIESIKLNPTIEKEYNQLGFQFFMKRYTKIILNEKTKIILNKSIISNEEYKTIVYLFFKNNYDVSIDCYIGNDYIIKREDYFKSL